jgi:3-hydroxyisobutyrate dehydrogenase
VSKEIVSYYENFKEIEKKIWDLLTNAVKDRSSEFRTPVFICGNDMDLDGRVVVLRKADQQNKIIQYHSDIRSSKIKKIKNNSNCSILFYGKEEKIQLRLKTECKVHFDDEVTKEAWEKTGHISRKCYLVTNGPGK